jgi:hypothetical protein
MATHYGPIQKVLVRASFYELEDRLRTYKALADEHRADDDVGSIDRVVACLHSDLDNMRPLLAR